MQNILSKYSILYLTNQTNRSAHKDYFSNPKGVTWEAVLNVQDWFTVEGGVPKVFSRKDPSIHNSCNVLILMLNMLVFDISE